jgi:quercetin dioxygenase-like cupin family protein
MPESLLKDRRLRRTLIGVIAAGAAIAISPAVLAASCPADKMGVDVRKPDPTPASGVTDNVLTSIDVAKEPVKIKGRLFRLRQLVVQPGGVVPWHSHGDRPAIIYIVSGEITEYASNCSVGIVHTAGDATPELHGTSHWWKNTGSTPTVLISADLLKVTDNPHMM